MNLLEPIHFDTPALAQQYAQRHRCALCLAALRGDGLYVSCPEHGQVYDHTVTSIHTAELAASDRIAGASELRTRKPRPAADILKELGY